MADGPQTETETSNYIKLSVEQTAAKTVDIFTRLPLAYKRYALFGDWLMVLGGLKGVTRYSLVGETWNEQRFAK